VVLVNHFWPEFISLNLNGVFFRLFGVVSCLLGTVMVTVSIAASNERVREWIKAILRGSDIQ